MKEMTITPDRVLELIEAYGAESGAWPEAERGAATKLLADTPEQFASALADARALDQLFLSEQMPEPSPALSEAILAAAPASSRARKSTFGSLSSLIFPQGVRWPAGAALASLLMGLVGGYSYASTGMGYDQADAAYYAAFDLDSSADWLVSE